MRGSVPALTHLILPAEACAAGPNASGSALEGAELQGSGAWLLHDHVEDTRLAVSRQLGGVTDKPLRVF